MIPIQSGGLLTQRLAEQGTDGTEGITLWILENPKFLKEKDTNNRGKWRSDTILGLFLCFFSFKWINVSERQEMVWLQRATPFLLCQEEKRSSNSCSLSFFLSVSLHAYQKPTKKIKCVKIVKRLKMETCWLLLCETCNASKVKVF